MRTCPFYITDTVQSHKGLQKTPSGWKSYNIYLKKTNSVTALACIFSWIFLLKISLIFWIWKNIPGGGFQCTMCPCRCIFFQILHQYMWDFHYIMPFLYVLSEANFAVGLKSHSSHWNESSQCFGEEEKFFWFKNFCFLAAFLHMVDGDFFFGSCFLDWMASWPLMFLNSNLNPLLRLIEMLKISLLLISCLVKSKHCDSRGASMFSPDIFKLFW